MIYETVPSVILTDFSIFVTDIPATQLDFSPIFAFTAFLQQEERKQ